jgi:Ca-activated chloride channel family protein
MIRFLHIEYLYGLLGIPVFILFFILMLGWKKRSLHKFGEATIINKLFPEASSGKATLKFILFNIAYLSLVIGIADPQMGTKLEEVKREGVDIIVALDVSNSMKAEDIKPDRLERSKQAIVRIIDKMQNDRIGLIIFAGSAYVQLPLTADYGAAKLFLSSIDTDIIPTQGTAIGSAITLASESFNKSDKKYKTMIIITDGENHEDDAIGEAKKAANEGIVIHTIGMGSPSGAPIPIMKGGTRIGYLKDNSGNVVVSKLDASILEKIAEAGKGQFVRASNSEDGLDVILQEINRMEKKNYGIKMYTDYEDRFQYFLLPAFLFLLWEVFISERKNKWLRKFNLFGEVKE